MVRWQSNVRDGLCYYINVDTGELTWECPEALKDEDGNFFWVAHDEDVFVPAKFIESRHSQVVVEMIGGQVLEVDRSNILDQIPSIKSLLQFPDDLIEMDLISEPAVLYSLRCRFLKDCINTSLGDMLIVINPFKALETPPIELYRDAIGLKSCPPHPYMVTARAFDQLISTGKNQTILIGGESGAGKL
jgi:myosin heavy chain 9/10/11/14